MYPSCLIALYLKGFTLLYTGYKSLLETYFDLLKILVMKW